MCIFPGRHRYPTECFYSSPLIDGYTDPRTWQSDIKTPGYTLAFTCSGTVQLTQIRVIARNQKPLNTLQLPNFSVLTLFRTRAAIKTALTHNCFLVGYKLVGNGSMICTERSQWNGTQPVCVASASLHSQLQGT